jgi:hypothetical protein
MHYVVRRAYEWTYLSTALVIEVEPVDGNRSARRNPVHHAR